MSEVAACTEAHPRSAGLLRDYRRSDSEFDELLDARGDIRPHYANLFRLFEQLGEAELSRRRDACHRLVHEQGITYQVYGDSLGAERPWSLDPIPLILPQAEWGALEAGLIQRATLLNRILADCYGAQDLIRSKWLPPALVFAQPDFLRPCHGIRVPRDLFLHFYAADLARSPDGSWWVTSDRAQIPTGAGYALANRLVTSRLLPEYFKDHYVHRLAGFFRDARNLLMQLAPAQSGEPRIVLLTPGPRNETFFEHAYLARYLGYSLVEGQDLTVRDNRLFLKTLGGLEPVQVILRRVDDDFCDPLELRNDSMLGVPGLVEALRAGNPAIANALGCGPVESPAFMPFLPGLCRHVLGEELKLPSVATWWCGQASARKHALEHLDELAVKPSFRPSYLAAAHNAASAFKADELRRCIEFDPDSFVAQETVRQSKAPVWDGATIVSRPIALRVYLVACDGAYRVMSGGLTRVSPGSGGGFISMQHGGGSKDTWVISDAPVEAISLLHGPGQAVELHRTGNNLPSRLADNFYWLGRYSERADAIGRLLRCALRRFNSERGGALPVLDPVLQTLEAQGQTIARDRKPGLEDNPEAFEAELFGAIFDAARPGSLRGTVEKLFRLAIQVRDRTSIDMWQVISQLHDRLSAPVASDIMLPGDAVQALNDALQSVAAFHGLARENMTRAQAWRFIDIGLRVERAAYLSALLDATLRSPEAADPSVLEIVLEAADSTITYRSRYSLFPHAAAVFDLVLLDDKNPRSVLFQINQLAKHIKHLPRENSSAAGPGQDILLECVSRLEAADARELAAAGENRHATKVAEAIRETAAAIPRFSDAISTVYFAHSSISRTGRGS